jgi:hypothetical protein
MNEVWNKMPCPICEAINWICLGDTTDLSGADIEAVKCHSCGSVFKTCDDPDVYAGRPKDDWWTEDGLEAPHQ